MFYVTFMKIYIYVWHVSLENVTLKLEKKYNNKKFDKKEKTTFCLNLTDSFAYLETLVNWDEKRVFATILEQFLLLFAIHPFAEVPRKLWVQINAQVIMPFQQDVFGPLQG